LKTQLFSVFLLLMFRVDGIIFPPLTAGRAPRILCHIYYATYIMPHMLNTAAKKMFLAFLSGLINGLPTVIRWNQVLPSFDYRILLIRICPGARSKPSIIVSEFRRSGRYLHLNGQNLDQDTQNNSPGIWLAACQRAGRPYFRALERSNCSHWITPLTSENWVSRYSTV